MKRTSTEIYNETTKWTMENANEYFKVFQEEVKIEPTWQIEKVKNFGCHKNVYVIAHKKTGQVLMHYGYSRLKDLMYDLEQHGYTYTIEMNRKMAA